ncbi:translation initiation factor EIF-2B subunit related [Plasmodium sp. DRC-Itaito]|nr:translation initiation factor EIF-2B subunit related [Plasmodium sp. DRC-Itaito]
MVNYDDITHTLLINKIKIKYDSRSEWNKYLKYSLRNPHSFIYPDISSRINNLNNKDLEFLNSSILSQGYKLNNIEKIKSDYTEIDVEKYILEIEKEEEKNLNKDDERLIRKIVSLFKECMYYFMCFNEKDGQFLDSSTKNSYKRDITHNSDYELFKSLNDCIIQLHDSKKNKNQAVIMTNEFCGIFTPNYIKLTKYTDTFINLLKEHNIKYVDLFHEEIKNNELYKKKKEHFEKLKNSSFMPLTKGEISLANKKKKKCNMNKNNDIKKNTVLKNKKEEENAKRLDKKNKKKKEKTETFKMNSMDDNKQVDGNNNKQVDGYNNKQVDDYNNKQVDGYNNKQVDGNNNNLKLEECIVDTINSCNNISDDEGSDEGSDVETSKSDDSDKNMNTNILNKKKRKKKRNEGEEDDSSYDDNNENKNLLKKNDNIDMCEEPKSNKELHKHTNSYDNEIQLKRRKKNNKKTENEEDIKTECNNLCIVEREEEYIGMSIYQNEDICNYLNIKNEYDKNDINENINMNAKIFTMLNNKIDSDEYIYKEMKNDFMKKMNLPNNYNYEVNVLEIIDSDIKKFYRCVVKYINKKKEHIKIYYIISNFVFFFSKMHKNNINFDDNIHKDINKNFDYKSIIIQGNMLPYNFFLFLKALHLMSTYEMIKNFFITIEYDERKNKCLHFLNITENKFYENFKKFEDNIKSTFSYIHKFLHNMIPVYKYTILNGKLYKDLEEFSQDHVYENIFQLTYYENNIPSDKKDMMLLLYDDKGDRDNYIEKGNICKTEGLKSINDKASDKHINNNMFTTSINNNNNNNNINNMSNYNNTHVLYHPYHSCPSNYIIYDSNNLHKMVTSNLKNNCRIIDDKELPILIKDVNDHNDNFTKILLKENRLLFLLDFYEKNSNCKNIIFNSVFFDSFISLIFIYYLNNYIKPNKKDILKNIPLFKPSYFHMFITQILKKKNEKKLKKNKRKSIEQEHTVDKLCNNFFKNSLNNILNYKKGSPDNIPAQQVDIQYNKDVGSQVENSNIALLNDVDDKPFVNNNIDEGNKNNHLYNSSITNSNESNRNNNNDVNDYKEHNNSTLNNLPRTIHIHQNNNIQEENNNLHLVENHIIVNESFIAKNVYENIIICIFVFINNNKSKSYSEGEKEIRELILYVLKNKEKYNTYNNIKYIFKYRNNINDAITLSEIEIRKYEYIKIFIIGLVLNNDISNVILQIDINNLYNLKDILHQKYPSKNFDIETKLFTFYWIYQVYIYGSIFLNDKEIPHAIRKVNDVYTLPYPLQLKSHVLWGYYLYIIQDTVESRYSEHKILSLKEQGIHVRLCKENFEGQIIEDDINDILHMHDLDINDIKYMDKNIFMNIIFLIENGHLTYFTFINTDNIHIIQRNNYLSIQIFKSKISFPSFNLNTPILNDSWLEDVLSKQTLLPFNDYFYKF